MTAKFTVGDKVKVVNYGHTYWKFKNGKTEILDMLPELIGQEGIICKVSTTQGETQYAIDGIPGKHAWYDEEQLLKQ